ncbi:MAG: DNA polymerase III subunit alpha, partial [Caldilineaceae bacterium]|nr:DNA polymerase III subunit alpha [Caldilineaceae bacterium]
VTLAEGASLVLLAQNQGGYANLCQLITASRLDQMATDGDGDVADEWPGKIEARLTWERLYQHADGLICLTGGRQGPLDAALLRHDFAGAAAHLQRLQEIFGPAHLYVELQHNYLPQTQWLNAQLAELAQQFELPLAATGNVYYAHPDYARLRDCVTAIRHHQTLTAARRAGHLALNSCYSLCSPPEMARRFAPYPQALAATVEIAQRCRVSLDFSQQRFPPFALENGRNEFAELYERCHTQLARKYPDLNPLVLSRLSHELQVIEGAQLAGFFLHVAHLMAHAARQGIRGQGRGSAGNSIVTYLLGITPIDPLAHGLLFERFLSTDRFTAPDIDIDFDTNRRDELIAYIYDHFGRDHVAMVCNHVTYRARSAIQDLGKVLEMPPAELVKLSHSVDAHTASAAAAQLHTRLPQDAPAHHPLRLLCELLPQLDGAPRHLGIHNGGMLITAQPLAQLAPLEPATMPGRMVVQWDKNAVEDCGLIKLDVLGLRALNVITDALAEIARSGVEAPDLTALDLADAEVYAMIAGGDTIGASQVESRAQMGFGPRLKPVKFTELMMQVAIVRPGPIQAGSVNPLLRRRAGQEAVTYVHACLEPVLHDTYGVLLYQEQAIQIAMAAAGFTAGEADLLRRALAREDEATIFGPLRQRFLEGAAKQGIDAAEAQAIYQQLAGFAGYGFCKSHAGSLAMVAYAHLWLKRYYPGPFYVALLNNQPMGFYSPEVLINDAKRHGVAILSPDIQVSAYDYTLTYDANGAPQLRTGLRAVKGMGNRAWALIVRARQERSFASLADLARRSKVPPDLLETLIMAGALDALGERRQLLWQLKQLDLRGYTLALPTTEPDIALPALRLLEQVAWEYELVGYSTTMQILALYRPQLRQQQILSSWEVKEAPAGQRVLVAGLTIVVQRPGTARGVTFQTLEDEAGTVDLVLKPRIYKRFSEIVRGERMVAASGIVQREGGAVNVLVGHMWGLSDISGHPTH